MKILHIDFESYSAVDIKKAGAYKYWEDAEIMLIGYARNDEPASVMDLFKENPPDWFRSALTDSTITKKAFNAAFERSAILGHFGIVSPTEQWCDTQALVALCGLPLNLADAARVLNLNVQKDRTGTDLIRYFCVPVKKPIAKNEFRTRNLPEHDPEKWERFKEYCRQDVEVERAISKTLSFCTVSAFERAVWTLDQQINDRGVGVNVPFVRTAIGLINDYEKKLVIEAKELTGLDNPKSVAQLKKWLFEEHDEDVESLNKESIPLILEKTDSNVVRRVLEIRQEGSKTSTKKYQAMMNALCRDGRLRGLHQYGGANRTMRAAGRMLQHQNLPRGKYKNIEPVRDLVMQNDPEWLEFVYGAIPDALSSLIRSALVPAPGNRFIISDYISIEALLLSFLAGERWVIDLFSTPEKPKMYEATASRMFNVRIEEVTPELRQKGKIACLALGYSGGVNAMIKMGALKEGLTEEELPEIVRHWRQSNPNIVNFWYALQKCAERAIDTGEKIYVHTVEIRGEYCAPNHGIYFHKRGPSLFFGMPSGRELVYCNVNIEDSEFGPRIIYFGVDQTRKRWSKLDTYSGKLAENLTQSVARDLLMHGLQNLDNAGYKIVLHVHDEAVVEMPIGQGSLEEVNRLMVDVPLWAKSLPLKAEGCESYYYKK